MRFADSARIRGMLVASLRNTLAEHGNKTATTLNIGALDSPSKQTYQPSYHPVAVHKTSSYYSAPVQQTLKMNDSYQVRTYDDTKSESEKKDISVTDTFPPLGFAKAQLHKTYIVSQTQNGIAIIDQHAAHERLTYEKMMANIGEHPQTQLLLMPEIVDLKPEEVAVLNTRANELKDMGWVLDAFGTDSIAVREIPALLDKTDIKRTVQDLVDTLKDFDDTILLKDKMKDICARIACHGSVRAGRILSIDEMNALLRQMEACGTSGQCIHGRPTYVELKLGDIEKLFGRK